MSIEKRRGEGEAGVGEAWSGVGSILGMCDLDCMHPRLRDSAGPHIRNIKCVPMHAPAFT